MNPWIGAAIYRGIDPAGKGYAELRVIGQWNQIIGETELKAAQAAAAARGVDA